MANEEEGICKSWRDTLLGVADIISPENETRWRSTLAAICNLIVEEGAAGLQRASNSRAGERNPTWSEWMKDNIALLWSEQIVVAKAVLQSLEDGIEF